MFDAAFEPKEMEIYPGSAHGTQLFSGGDGEQVVGRILAFVEAYSPP
jgi:hypothetical protein